MLFNEDIMKERFDNQVKEIVKLSIKLENETNIKEKKIQKERGDLQKQLDRTFSQASIIDSDFFSGDLISKFLDEENYDINYILDTPIVQSSATQFFC